MMVLSVLLLLLAVIGAPLFVVIAGSAMLGYYREGIDLMAIAVEVLGIASMPFLSAIPLFTFAGYLLSESNAPRRLVRLTGCPAVLPWFRWRRAHSLPLLPGRPALRSSHWARSCIPR